MDHPTTKCYWGACMNVPESSKHACEYHRQSEAAYRCEKRAQNHEKRDSILNTPLLPDPVPPNQPHLPPLRSSTNAQDESETRRPIKEHISSSCDEHI